MTTATDTVEALRVLVVEDEAMVAMLLEDMLLDLGCRAVEIASRLDTGVRAAQQGDFGFAVLDVNLDGVKSFPIADALRLRGIPFIFASGYGTSGLEQRYADVPTLQKPFRAADLASMVASALGDR